MEEARARAVLGIGPGASQRQVRRAYLGLVRRWHPDRFRNDPAGQREANAHLRQVVEAYRVLQAGSATVAPAASPAGGTLTQEEIERIVRAIGDEPPLAILFRWLSWALPLAAAALLFGADFRRPWSYGLHRRPLSRWELAAGFLLLGVAAVLWVRWRRKER